MGGAHVGPKELSCAVLSFSLGLFPNWKLLAIGGEEAIGRLTQRKITQVICNVGFVCNYMHY